MQKNYYSYTVIIADDSKLVCTSLSSILRNMGFNQGNIHLAYKPAELIAKCNEIKFDVIICDYNFNSNLNGNQLFSEIKNSRAYDPRSVFIFLTGENNSRVVRSILDAEPDDYILKPFTKEILVKRLRASISRKRELIQIYAAIAERNYHRVITECEQHLVLNNEHQPLIRKIKSEAHLELGQISQAKSEYESMLEDYDYDWIKISLANLSIKANKIEQAKLILEKLKDKETSPYYHDNMSSISLLNNDLPNAIHHLKSAELLLDGGQERDLVISNLFLAMGEYENAYLYAKKYHDQNKYTYRSTNKTRLIYVRYYLIYLLNNNEQSHCAFEIDRELSAIKLNLELLPQVEVIQVGLNILSGNLINLHDKIERIISTESIFSNLDFYDLYFFAFILSMLSLDNQTKYVLHSCKKSIVTEKNEVSITNDYLLKQLKNRFERNIEKVTLLQKDIENHRLKSSDDFFETLFELQRLQPFCIKVCSAIIHILANVNKTHKDKIHILKMLQNSFLILSELLSNQPNRLKKIREKYQMALKKIM
ncbi:response regulator [Shewanella litorisediminis]|uniref:Response regulator n=1 Tax=Shewanella litorisediminis TaxID=1173586 RepID=A0ABX7G6K7_9GAMM|nr:response regulator [Shewanella litorisediminis]MCL2917728.1 response regulator [Shewanella litorisediminis]QRH02847.1 response regulator [Shewanella litorisediminis]